MAFSVKDWHDRPAELDPEVGETVADWFARITAYAAAHPGELTPVSAAALEDLEDRLSDYTDALSASVTSALAAKAPLASPALTGTPTAPTPSAADNDTSIATTAFVQGEIAAKAPLASPAFTGNPTAPTPSTSDDDTSIATTAFVQAAIGAGGSFDPDVPLAYFTLHDAGDDTDWRITVESNGDGTATLDVSPAP